MYNIVVYDLVNNPTSVHFGHLLAVCCGLIMCLFSKHDLKTLKLINCKYSLYISTTFMFLMDSRHHLHLLIFFCCRYLHTYWYLIKNLYHCGINKLLVYQCCCLRFCRSWLIYQHLVCTVVSWQSVAIYNIVPIFETRFENSEAYKL